MPRIPSLTLPTDNFEEMLEMSNRRLIYTLRMSVFSAERARHFRPQPPENHDAYIVHQEPGRITVHILADGKEVFDCFIVPSDQ